MQRLAWNRHERVTTVLFSSLCCDLIYIYFKNILKLHLKMYSTELIYSVIIDMDEVINVNAYLLFGIA